MADVTLIGRVGADLPPEAPRVALEHVSRFGRTVGGYGGNVGTGLARLGVSTAVVATVGDDGHGRFARAFLATEGADVTAMRLDDRYRTPLAFYEVWPPDRFPVTFYPTPAYWALSAEQVEANAAAARLLLVSAATLAHEPARSLVLDALGAAAGRRDRPIIVIDLDWRPMLWEVPGDAPGLARQAVALADVVIGSEAEFEALGLAADEVAAARAVYLKRGELGARFVGPGEQVDAAPIRVETLSGLGSGDAFAAAVVEGILAGRPTIETLRRANAAGAIVASRLTCADAMPTPAEIDALLAGTSPAHPVPEEVAR